MKRFILPLFLLLLFSPGFTQIVNLTGTVTDSATGVPIANQEVQISSDSSIGFYYVSIVYTDQNGDYHDSIPLNGGVTNGVLNVLTIDCAGFPVYYSVNFDPANMNPVQDFQICSGSPCQASFSYANTLPLTIQFTDASTGTTGPWMWQFGDGTSSSQQNPSHTYQAGGYYNVSLTIGDSATSCWDMILMTVYVIDSTGGGCEADFYYYPDSTIAMTTYQFVDASSGSIASWHWDFGDGTFSSLQNPLHTFDDPGFYTVCLTVQGADSLCYDSYCEILNVGGGTGCQAQFTYYSDSNAAARLIHFVDLSYGDITSWEWDFGDLTYSSEQNPSHTFPEDGTYYVCLTVTGNNAGTTCQSTWCKEVTFGGGSDCASYFTYQNNELSINFTGHMINIEEATYYWEFGDGQSGQGQTIVHQYPASGIYYVTLTTVIQSPVPCTFTTAQSITVGDSTQWNQIYGQVFAGNFPLESGMVMIFSLDTISPAFTPFIDIGTVDSSGVYYFPMVPLGEYVIYAIPFIPTGYLPTYYGDVLFWEDATVVTLGQANNPYNINLIDANSYNPGPGGINGQINTLLKSPVMDKITMLLMNEAGEGISYHQVDVDGQFDFSNLDYGIYYLKGEFAGCQSDYVKVEITPEKPTVEIIMTLDGNNLLGTPEISATLDAGLVFPNPTTDIASINLKLNESTQVYVELYNLSGQRLYQDTQSLNAGSSTVSVPVSKLREGLYTIRIYTNSGLNLTRKLLKSQ